MEIKIPQKFEKCLAADSNWKRRVEDLTGRLKDILGQSTDFFPEYTEHGLRHVNTVLELAADLIPGKSIARNTISPRDAACLIAAIAIHDLGMFLTPAGLDLLMSKQWDIHRNERLDEHSWEDTWARYISTTKRLPQEQMKRCFGKMIQVEKTSLVKDQMIWDDKLVIGEFLRRNHPRLAQEIAVAGMPGTQLQHFLADTGFEADERSVIGLMARSHGMTLREVEDYLGPDAYLSNVPVYYLMAILRLADYLDASQERAPMIRVKQENLGSPLSKEEWALNRCFKIDSSRWYPEKKHYTIAANPATSSEYARLEKWLEHAQRELDLSWAALAEKYPDGKLKLSIHRIKCTMHEKRIHEDISDRILPGDVRVTANPEIVKLMIEPLYGDDPTYGVRELLQNAVDACVERKQWEEDRGNKDYKGLVDIRVEGDTFTITDNGMGMNEDILLNYYLSAGSSYRDSEAWKAANAPDGTSRVARTGKFGVGFLAAFLLGDEIEVHTQHREDKKGYQFKFDQRSMPLDVTRAVRHNDYAEELNDSTGSGTTITIKLKQTAREKWETIPSWHNWYAFDEPEVRYTIDNAPRKHQNLRLHRPPAGNDDWLELTTKGYESYLWRPNMKTERPEFYCNGIRIYVGYKESLEWHGLNVYVPHVSLIDKEARLDVDLARKEIKSIPEKEALFREVFRWHIARLLLTPWDSEQACRENLTLGFDLRPGDHMGRIPFLLSSGGFTLNHASVLSAIPLKEYVILYYEGSNAGAAIRTARDFLEGVPCSITASDAFGAAASADHWPNQYYYSPPAAFAHDLLYNSTWLYNISAIRYPTSSYAAAVWLREDVWQSSAKNLLVELPLSEISHADGILTAHFQGRDSDMPICLDRFLIKEFPVAVHVKPDFHGDADSLFVQTLKETLTPSENYDPNDIWIPFDMEERERKFRKAFENLKPYMDNIRKHPIE